MLFVSELPFKPEQLRGSLPRTKTKSSNAVITPKRKYGDLVYVQSPIITPPHSKTLIGTSNLSIDFDTTEPSEQRFSKQHVSNFVSDDEILATNFNFPNDSSSDEVDDSMESRDELIPMLLAKLQSMIKARETRVENSMIKVELLHFLILPSL